MLTVSAAAATSSTPSLLASLYHVSCPCVLTVSASHNAPRFDILIMRDAATAFDTFLSRRSITLRHDAQLSRFDRGPAEASAHDALFSYHVVHIKIPMLMSVIVSVRNVSRSSSAPSITSTSREQRERPRVHLQATPSSRQDLQCPVILGRDRSSDISSTPTPRIVGGESASSELARYLAFLVIPSSEGTRACSGTIVGPRLIITAAHCGVNINSDIYVGGRRGNPSNGDRRSVAFAQIHPGFAVNSDTRFQSDISFVTLSEDVPNNIGYMKVNINASVPEDGSVVRAAGYGIFRHGDSYSNPNSQLRFVDIPTVPRSTCEQAYRAEALNINYDFQVCAGYYGRGGCDSW